MDHYGNTNPIDVLEIVDLEQRISSQLYNLRRGLRLMVSSWQTSSSGLSTAVLAASSLDRLTAECYRLLLSMETRSGNAIQEADPKQKTHSASIETNSTSDLDNRGCGPLIIGIAARPSRAGEGPGFQDPEISAEYQRGFVEGYWSGRSPKA